MASLTPAYIVLSIAALLIISLLVFFKMNSKKKEGLSQLASLAFVLIISGIFFGNDMMIGYILIILGIILAVIDIAKKSKKK